MRYVSTPCAKCGALVLVIAEVGRQSAKCPRCGQHLTIILNQIAIAMASGSPDFSVPALPVRGGASGTPTMAASPKLKSCSINTIGKGQGMKLKHGVGIAAVVFISGISFLVYLKNRDDRSAGVNVTRPAAVADPKTLDWDAGGRQVATEKQLA